MKNSIVLCLLATMFLTSSIAYANTESTILTELESIQTVELANKTIPNIKMTGSTVQNLVGGSFADNNSDSLADMLYCYGSGYVDLKDKIQTFKPNTRFGSIRSYFDGHPDQVYFAIAEVKATNSNVMLYLNDGKKQYGDRHSGNGQFETLAVKMRLASDQTDSYIKVQDNRTGNWTETQVKEGITVIKLKPGEVDLSTDILLEKYAPVVGYESVSNVQFVVTNKNLISKEEFVEKTINNATNTYAKVENVDGRHVLAFTGKSSYLGRKLGLEIFKPNTQYTFKVDAKNNGVNGGVYVITHTDGSKVYMTYGGATTSEFETYKVNSIAGKTVEDIYITYNSGGVNYYDLDTLCIRETSSTNNNDITNKTRITNFPVSLASLGDVYDELIVTEGVAKKIEKNKIISLSGNLDWEWSREWSGAESKRVRLLLSDSKTFTDYTTENALVTKHNKQPLVKADTNDMKPDTHNLWSKYLYINIDNIDSGWDEGYIPSNDEVKAYFYGWRMNSDLGTWRPIGDSNESRVVSTLPLYPSPTIKEGKISYYTALYQLETPNELDVLYDGDTPVLSDDENNIFIRTNIDKEGLGYTSRSFKFHVVLDLVNVNTQIVDSLLRICDESRKTIVDMNTKINDIESKLNEVLNRLEERSGSGNIEFKYDDNGNLVNTISK
ncbi:hypothetical protein [Fusibacter sp. JL216-2]|uniref:hypothetical protein n=1 Tax=Fusibacter sp. JL216-2 TaxID=3071453 RepID=UPI003D340F9B